MAAVLGPYVGESEKREKGRAHGKILLGFMDMERKITELSCRAGTSTMKS